jgi:hypothetical protein
MNNACEVVITTITPNGSAALPFVIPSVAEGSAVHSAFATKMRRKNKLSSRPKMFPRMVRGTADPSATLGMTKGRAALSFGSVAGDR